MNKYYRILDKILVAGKTQTNKKGTYKIRITAAKTSKYQKAVKYVTVKVK